MCGPCDLSQYFADDWYHFFLACVPLQLMTMQAEDKTKCTTRVSLNLIKSLPKHSGLVRWSCPGDQPVHCPRGALPATAEDMMHQNTQVSVEHGLDARDSAVHGCGRRRMLCTLISRTPLRLQFPPNTWNRSIPSSPSSTLQPGVLTPKPSNMIPSFQNFHQNYRSIKQRKKKVIFPFYSGKMCIHPANFSFIVVTTVPLDWSGSTVLRNYDAYSPRMKGSMLSIRISPRLPVRPLTWMVPLG